MPGALRAGVAFRAWRHGVNGYRRQKCRCETCRAAWAKYLKAARARRRARGVCIECNTPSPQFQRCLRHRLAMRERNRRNWRESGAGRRKARKALQAAAGGPTAGEPAGAAG